MSCSTRAVPSERINSSSRSASHTKKPSASISARVRLEPKSGAPEATPEVALLGGIAESCQPDVVTGWAEHLQEAPDVRRPTDRHDRDAFGAEIAAAPAGQRFERELVADPFDEHDRTAVDAGIDWRCRRATRRVAHDPSDTISASTMSERRRARCSVDWLEVDALAGTALAASTAARPTRWDVDAGMRWIADHRAAVVDVSDAVLQHDEQSGGGRRTVRHLCSSPDRSRPASTSLLLSPESIRTVRRGRMRITSTRERSSIRASVADVRNRGRPCLALTITDTLVVPPRLPDRRVTVRSPASRVTHASSPRATSDPVDEPHRVVGRIAGGVGDRRPEPDRLAGA